MPIIFAVLSAFAGEVAFAWTAGNYLGLDLKQNRYLGEVQNSAQEDNYTLLSGDLNLEKDTKPFANKLTIVAQDAIEARNEFYFGVPEAYLQFRPPGILTVTIGRQKRLWNRLDEEFNLGVWQPQLRWDYLNPKQQGLIGTFFDFNFTDSFRLTLFMSPVYLPDQGPNYELKDGKFSSSNRWFSQPSSRVNFIPESHFGKDAPLYFKLDRPSEKSVILNQSFAVGALFRPTKYWLQGNYAYKPMNQIHLGLECAGPDCANLGGSSAPVDFTAVIHPMVVKHQVFTIETGFDDVDSNWYLSLTADIPNRSDYPSGPMYMESPLDSMLIAGAAYQHYVFNLMGVPTWAKLSYVKVATQQSRDAQGSVDVDQVHSSLDRYPYREIAATEWKILARQKRTDHLEFRLRYNYSIPENGGWLSSALAWNQDPLTWTLGMDFLGSGVDIDSPQAGLYTRYRSNDRVFGGVNYVF